MKRIGFAMLALWAATASAGECSIAYLRGGEPSKFDPMAHQALDSRYQIIDIDPVEHHFVDPKAVSGSMPTTPMDENGQPVHGYVLLAYVITTTGHAESPTIVKTSNPKLSALALSATDTWRLDPGQADGKVVCVVAMQEFHF